MGNSHRILATLLLAACGAVENGNPLADAPVAPDAPEVCAAESVAELCARNGATCGSVTAIDNCGDERTVDCGACPPVCTDLEFALGAFIDEINATGQQDAIAGHSASGTTLLTQRRAVCAGPFTLLLTDGIGTQPTTSDITGLPNLAAMNTEREAAVTLTADGLTLLGTTRTDTGLVAATRSAIGNVDFSPATAGTFAAITVPAAPGFLSNPVLSADGLELYYQVLNLGPGLDGIYSSVRGSTAQAFPPGARTTDPFLQEQAFVTGISSDRLSLFVQGNQGMFVLTRTAVAQPFTNTNAPALPPQVPGFRTRPLGDCQTLIGTCTGGCLNEETCRISHTN
jgi:hypothetical protein